MCLYGNFFQLTNSSIRKVMILESIFEVFNFFWNIIYYPKSSKKHAFQDMLHFSTWFFSLPKLPSFVQKKW